MKTVMVGILALLLGAGSCFAQASEGVGTPAETTQAPQKKSKKPLYIATAEAFVTCGIAIGLSSNPAGAAMVGLPILTGGTIAAYKLYPKHSRLAVILQSVSGLGCMARIGKGHHVSTGRKVKPPTSTTPPANGGGSGNPPTTTGGGSGSGGSGGTGGSGGSTGGSGGGNGTGSGGSGSGSGGSGGSGGTGGSGGSGSGSGGSGGSGGGNPPPTNGGGKCIQDCGFPGNGGVNGGHDTNKPPFPGKGNGGSNVGNGNKGDK